MWPDDCELHCGIIYELFFWVHQLSRMALNYHAVIRGSELPGGEKHPFVLLMKIIRLQESFEKLILGYRLARNEPAHRDQGYFFLRA